MPIRPSMRPLMRPLIRSRHRNPLLAITASAVMVATAVTPVVLTTMAGPAQASVPAAPAGWSTIFSDDFSGTAGSGLNTGTWLYDSGHGYSGGAYNWGTGEIESNTSSTANVYQDGSGHLVIKPIRDASGNWTSGRVETQRTDLAAPAGGELEMVASLQQPNVTVERARATGPRSGPSATWREASVPRTGRRSARST